MSSHLRVIPDERLQRSQYDLITLVFKVTAAKTVSQMTGLAAPVIVGFDAASFTQAAADALSQTASSGITVTTSFGTTAMGTDSFGFIIANGAARKVAYVRAETIQTAGGSPANTLVIFEGDGALRTALPDTLTNRCTTSSEGMIYGRFVAANLDSVTTGVIHLTIAIEQA